MSLSGQVAVLAARVATEFKTVRTSLAAKLEAVQIGTVATGSPGSLASASISGSAPTQLLNLTIPQGAQGAKGDPGDDANVAIPQLAGWYAALSDSVNSPADVLIVGDSIWEGYGASSWKNRRPVQLQNALRSRYPSNATGGAGFIPARYNYSDASATAWNSSGTVVNQAKGLGLRGQQMSAGTNFTITRECTSFDLHFYRLSGAGDAVNISIDGGAATTFTLNPSGPLEQKWTSPVTWEGAHTISISHAGGAPVFCGGMFYTGDETKGVRVWDASTSGAQSTTFSTNTPSTSTEWADWIGIGVNPDLVVLATIVNDVPNKTAAQYKDSMSALIDVVRAKTSAPILLLPHWKPLDRVITSSWADYLTALEQLSTEKTRVAFFERDSIVGDLAGDPYGLLMDGVHLNDKGHRFARDIDLIPMGGSGQSTNAISSANYANTLVQRNEWGGFGVGYIDLYNNPTNATHATTKSYVDDGLAGKVSTNDARLSDARTPTAHSHVANDISNASTVGKSVLTAANAADARTAIGATNLVIGTTATTAKAGDYTPPSDQAAGTASMRTLGTGATQAAAGNHNHIGLYPTVVKASGGTYPARPTGAVQVIWIGTTDPGAAALDGDMWVNA